MIRASLLGPLAAATLSCFATPAPAHAVLERREAQPDTFYRAVIQITHGCKASPTTSVTVTLPDGAIGARPMAKPGWTITTRRGPYRRAYAFVHGSISEGVQEITWSGNSVPADQFDEFVFSVRLSEHFKPGDVAYFPTVQTCESGAHRWVEVPGQGRSSHDLAEPAPALRIAAAEQAAPAPVSIRGGDLLIEQPWMRATPGGAKVAGGYVRISNGGSASDRLLGASIPLAARAEVHEMSNEGGVMKMRPVEGGLEIKPGQTVELKPGGYHLMFMDLSGGAKEGDSVRGTLVFEKAGTVEVDFAVAGIGARGPAGAQGHH